VIRFLGVFNNFMVEYGMMNAHGCVRGLFSFPKYNIGE